ncbi:histidine kinase N-terminal 7TM domain-containing protein [Sphingomonas aurantiaca]|uniref:histidine kinase N-terminal 7TM domain-containing protein n=1 Tax=Sphingomonas aurantiaca TaxID=185949 RepID=UPI002FE0D8D7
MDTAIGIVAYVGALGLTAVASLMLALFVVTRARALPGSALLALFLVGVASWSIAQAIPAIVGPAATPFTATLIALSPLPAAAFVHLVFAFALCGTLRPVAIASYAIAGFATLVGLIFGVGAVVPWHGFPGMFVPSIVGWGVLGLAGLLSVIGHLRLAQTWVQQQGQHRRQAGAVFASSLIGLVALTGFTFPALGIDAYPWPVLLLPLYSVALVYGILRYRFMATDLWARRGLVWILLVALAGAVSAGIATVPLVLVGRPAGLLATWAALAATLALGILVLAPLKRLVDAVVFPGGRVSDADVADWRDQAGRGDRRGRTRDNRQRVARAAPELTRRRRRPVIGSRRRNRDPVRLERRAAGDAPRCRPVRGACRRNCAPPCRLAPADRCRAPSPNERGSENWPQPSRTICATRWAS